MHQPSLAIDFGTSRTKVGWRDENNQIHLIDWNGSPYLPSIFHLPLGSKDILVGDEALEALVEDPAGGIENFKRQIIEFGQVEQTSKDRQDSPEQLLVSLFKLIRTACFDQIPALQGILPENITLTMPATRCDDWNNLLGRGAEAVGFPSVQMLKEPIAAARGWFYTQDKHDGSVLVLDCGGGTTDLALLDIKHGRIALSDTHAPVSMELGGSDVDKALLQSVLQTDGEIVGNDMAKRRRLLYKIREYKEAILSGKNTKPPRVAGRALSLNETAVLAAYEKAFIDPLMMQISRTLELVVNNDSETVLLLVGGGAGTQLLDTALKNIAKQQLQRLPDSGLAVLKGCLSTPTVMEEQAAIHNKKFWNIPDIHGWSIQQVKKWQTEVAKGLGVAAVYQCKFNNGTKGPNLTLIPQGKFNMSSSHGGICENERPQIQTTIRKPFYLAQCSLTFNHYDYYCKVTGCKKPNDMGWGRGSRPVINVCRSEANNYCQWLSEVTGERFMLPSEAQWEYACRAGSTTAYSFGKDINTSLANYDDFQHKTVPVGNFMPNPWGGYDMHGNVWEWTSDDFFGHPSPFEGSYAIVRGGSWYSKQKHMSSSYREKIPEGDIGDNIGFRIIMDCF